MSCKNSAKTAHRAASPLKTPSPASALVLQINDILIESWSIRRLINDILIESWSIRQLQTLPPRMMCKQRITGGHWSEAIIDYKSCSH